MSDDDTRPQTVVLAVETLAYYREQLKSIGRELGVALGTGHPSIALLGEAAEKLAEPGILPQRSPDHPTGYAPYA